MTLTDSAVEYTREELVEEIDQGSRRAIGLSASELARTYRDGKLEEPTGVADLIALLNLLPEDDALFKSK
jgi:hypothetical protein